MAANFRKAYYSSLGVQFVEAKRTVESALQGDLLDLERLNKLCLWVRIPHLYRPQVWKVLLGVLPLTKQAWPFVEDQQRQQFEDLKNASYYVFGYGRVQIGESEVTADDMVRMLLIEMNSANPHNLKMVGLWSVTDIDNLYPIATSILDICDSRESDSFWIFKMFIQKFNAMYNLVPAFNTQESKSRNRHGEDLLKILAVHDNSLVEYISNMGIDLGHATTSWFRSAFSEILPSHCLEGVWDILIGGAPDILLYVAASLLLASKRKIETMKSVHEFEHFLPQIGEFVNADAVASTAINLWEKPVLQAMSEITAKKAM
ncbi:TBC1 domain member 7 [Chytridiales sp. JEL 0842]|nr:TBC1 domain member 7 [Chytridiales sp. JEL 0842]